MSTRRVEQIAADRGGKQNLSTLEVSAIERLVEVELFLSSWVQYFHTSSPMTPRGRVRFGYTQYLATLDRWTRLATLVGLPRQAADIGLSLEDYLRQGPQSDKIGGQRVE